MYLNIKPIHIDGLDCFGYFVLSLANHYNREYPLTFAGTFGFEYLPEYPEYPGIIGVRLSAGSGNMFSLSEKYCGISFRDIEVKSATEAIDIIKGRLLLNLPTATYINSYWCPWHNEYQKVHHNHYCLVVGIDSDNTLICIDPVIGLDTYYLPYSDLENGFGLVSVINIEETPQSIDYTAIVKDSVEKIKLSNISQHMENFIYDFSTKFDFNKEFESSEVSKWDIGLTRNLGFICGGRFLYSEFIKHIAEKTQWDALMETDNSLSTIKWRWDFVKSMFTKAFYTGYSDKIKEKICKTLKEILILEENYVSNLYDVVNATDTTSKTNKNLSKSSALSVARIEDYVYIDLQKLFNRIAFHSSKSLDCLADFTGLGQYFLSYNAPSDQIVDSGNMRFQFPIISDNTFDHIACEEQIIDVPDGIYNGIMIMGTSEWGSYQEFIKLNYSDGESVYVQIDFSDWYSDKPLFDEQIIWCGKVFDKKENVELDKNLNIYALYRPLPKHEALKSITLPDCINIHIFAITLCK